MQLSWNQLKNGNRNWLILILFIVSTSIVWAVVQQIWWVLGIPVVLLVILSSLLFTEKRCFSLGHLHL